jgi:hypothetical protein
LLAEADDSDRPVRDHEPAGSYDPCVSEVSFPGLPEFSDATRFGALLWLGLRGPPYPFRLVITDSAVRIEGRGRVLRALLPARCRALQDVVSARLRGTLVILYFRNDAWWTFSSMMRCRKIIRELEQRGVPTTQDR